MINSIVSIPSITNNLYRNFNKFQFLTKCSRFITSSKSNIAYNHNKLIHKQQILFLNNNFNKYYTTTSAVIPESYSEVELETVESIKMLIEKRIRPVVQQDGGDVSFVSFDPSTGFVYVRLSGACVGCIQSDITLKHMIQGMLCHYIEEITAVYNVDENNNVVTSDSNDDY